MFVLLLFLPIFFFLRRLYYSKERFKLFCLIQPTYLFLIIQFILIYVQFMIPFIIFHFVLNSFLYSSIYETFWLFSYRIWLFIYKLDIFRWQLLLCSSIIPIWRAIDFWKSLALQNTSALEYCIDWTQDQKFQMTSSIWKPVRNVVLCSILEWSSSKIVFLNMVILIKGISVSPHWWVSHARIMLFPKQRSENCRNL